jgi:hypothetical protein
VRSEWFDVGSNPRADSPSFSYFDNVGGETFEAALDNAAAQARFIVSSPLSYAGFKLIALIHRNVA